MSELGTWLLGGGILGLMTTFTGAGVAFGLVLGRLRAIEKTLNGNGPIMRRIDSWCEKTTEAIDLAQKAHEEILKKEPQCATRGQAIEANRDGLASVAEKVELILAAHQRKGVG